MASNNKKYRLSLRKLLYAALLLALLPFIATHLNTFFNKNTAASLVGGANRAVVKAPTLRYGFVLDSFQVVDSELQENERLADVLTAGGIDEQTAKILLRRTARFCDPAKLEVGSTYLWLNSIRGTNTPEFFVIEPDAAQYIVFDLRDTLDVYQVHRPTDVRLASTAGVVYKDFWQTIDEVNLDDQIASKMQDALNEAFDFHSIGKNDKFKVIYNRRFIDGAPAEATDLKAVQFEQGKDAFYAFKYKVAGKANYYDYNGRPYKAGFLQAPVKLARVSSGYNLNRMHPILGYVRPHKGTDYAAPLGTPIMSVADGVVSAATSGGGNGNFVKVRHDRVYETQYLHMSRFANGIHAGVKVKQGQVIGYVGSSGLSTGPHCCFRFWKNGAEVDHRSLKLPRAEPLPTAQMGTFKIYRDSLLLMMQQTSYPTLNAQKAMREERDGLASHP